MASRLDMLAGLALAGLCASPRARAGADPHSDADMDAVARRAVALAGAVDKLLGSGDAVTAGVAASAPTLGPDDVRGIVRDMLEEIATAPAPKKKGGG